MSDGSAIEWTNATWNWLTGCRQIPGAKGRPSGCDNCYAKRLIDTRLRNMPKHPHYGYPFETVLSHPQRLVLPLMWTKPRKIFVNSMSDVFHEEVSDHDITRAMVVMAATPRHTYQLLTKRPERMRRYLRSVVTFDVLTAMQAVETICTNFWHDPPHDLGGKCHTRGAAHSLVLPATMPYPNVWLGVSVSTRDDLWRIDMLRETPAAIRFLSIEPLLGDVGELNLDGIHWVIVGGESGPGARPLHQQWALSVRDQCEAAKVPFFFKQWGEWKPLGTLNGIMPLIIGDKRQAVLFRDGTLVTDKTLLTVPTEKYAGANAEMVKRVGKAKAGRELGGREWNEFPKMPEAP